MGSLKKKFAKTLRKITPKEIAPILPFIAMAIPGMQGLSPLLKVALPQLLTAAGSARQTGKINLMNQAMAGLGSLASINATNAAAATAAGTGLQGSDAYAALNASGAMGSLPGSVPPLPGGTNLGPAAYANANVNPDLYSSALNVTGGSTVNNAINNAAQLVGNNQLVAPLGNALNNPGLNLPYAMAVGGTGGSMAAGDYATKKQMEFEEDEEREQGYITAYKNATRGFADYLSDKEYTLEDLYGVGNVPDFLLPSFSAANGGRAQLAVGGMSPGERNAREGHQNENSGGSGGGNNNSNSGGYNPHTPSGTSLGQQFSGQTQPGPGSGSGGGNNNGNGNNVAGPQLDPNNITIDKAVVNLDPNPITPNYDYYKNQEEDYGVVGNYLKDIIENKAISLTDNLDLGINKKGLEFNYGFADGGRIGFNEGGGMGDGNNPDVPPSQRKGFKKYNPSSALPQNLGQAEIYRTYMDQLPADNAIRQNYFTTGQMGLVPRENAAATDTGQNTFGNNNNDMLTSIALSNQYDPFANNLAKGGRIGFSEGSDPDMDRVIELEQQGFSYEEAFEIAMKELMNRDYNANGGRIGLANGGMEGIMGAMQAPGVPAGMELDYRSSGGFIPMGGPEKADDVPAMLSKNEFVMTADAVRGLGNGDVESGAQQMYDLMNNLEAQA